MAIQTGKVTERKGARLHAIVDGHAPCHSGHGKILARNERYVGAELTPTTARRFCRTKACQAAIRAQIEQAQDRNARTASSPRRYREESALIALHGLFATPAEKARLAELVSRWPVPPVLPIPRPLDGRAALLALLAEPTELAGQLALFAA